MNSECKEKFGVYRSKPINNEYCTLTHLLPERHAAYNDKIKNILATGLEALMKQKKDLITFQSTIHRYQVELITPDKFEKWVAAYYRTRYATNEEEQRQRNQRVDLMNTILLLQCFMKEVSFDHTNVSFVVGSMLIETEKNEWTLLTRHVSWFWSETPAKVNAAAINSLKKQAWVSLVHTHRSNLDLLLYRTAPIWAEVLSWDGKDKENFEKKFRELEYNLYQTMPFFRGSAGSNENLLNALKQHFKADMAINKDMDIFSTVQGQNDQNDQND